MHNAAPADGGGRPLPSRATVPPVYDLDQVIPVLVAVRFGGRRVLAGPLRLRQFAALQAWLRRAIPHPIEAARAELAELDGEARALRAGELIRAGVDHPVRLFTPDGDAALSSPPGRAMLAVVALAESNPGVDVAGLADVASDDEWAALARVLYGTDPLGELLRIADPGPADEGEPEPTNWGRIVADLADAGRDPGELAEWTLAQLAAVRHRGERLGLLPVPRDGETDAEACARRRRVLGIPDDEPADLDDPEIVAFLARAEVAERLRAEGVTDGG